MEPNFLELLSNFEKKLQSFITESDEFRQLQICISQI